MKRRARKPLPIYRRQWDSLIPALQEKRMKSLEVLRKVRQGSSLSSAAKEIGISPSTAKNHLGKALVKSNASKYQAKPTDKISRSMVIYRNGKQVAITVKDSKTASTIGQYFNAVREYLNSGDSSGLKKFKKSKIVDSRGKKYRLETTTRKIRDIESKKEGPEFFDIYNTGS
jgi:predicted ArsR family transcriptional regulator